MIRPQKPAIKHINIVQTHWVYQRTEAGNEPDAITLAMHPALANITANHWC